MKILLQQYFNTSASTYNRKLSFVLKYIIVVLFIDQNREKDRGKCPMLFEPIENPRLTAILRLKLF